MPADREPCPCQSDADDPGPHIASCPWSDLEYGTEAFEADMADVHETFATAATPIDPATWFADLERIAAELRALPRVVRRIDAPSTVIAALRLRCETAPTRALDADYRGIDLRVDDDLPMHTVRRHWSDGTVDTMRLDAPERREEE